MQEEQLFVEYSLENKKQFKFVSAQESRAISIIEQKVKNAENLVIYYGKKMKLENNDKYLDLIAIAQDQLIIYDNLLREINEANNGRD